MKHFVFLIATFVFMCRGFAQQSDSSLLILSDSKSVPDSAASNNGSNLRTSPALHSLTHSKQASNISLPPDPVVVPKKGTIIMEHKKGGINNQ